MYKIIREEYFGYQFFDMEAENFDTWLSDKFRELNTDEAVFVPYIKSIVEGDETTDEKIDALDGILGELTGVSGNYT